MEGLWDALKNEVLTTYAKEEHPAIRDQLLYAVVVQLDKISAQLDELGKQIKKRRLR
jgi:hypothetical protein